MVSDFLVLDNEPFFQLNENEFKQALRKYPELNSTDNFYLKNSATIHLEPGKARDGYIDNELILEQFERLFKLLKFKKSYENKKIIIIVDNATTHTAREYTIKDFSMKSGTKCPVEKITWVQDDVEKSLNCFYPNGLSKGLLVIGRELGLIKENEKLKLDDLRNKVGEHAAFKNKCKLKLLAERFSVEIIFSPKYHCELNPIEGLWCFQKVNIRKNTDGTFEKLVELIDKTKEMFQKQNINIRLWNRFFNTINDYENDASYEEILKKYFGIKTKPNVKEHRTIQSF
jgi:hypothetical protein